MSNQNSSMIGPFHTGEIQVQRQAGVFREAQRVGAIVERELSDGAEDFLARQKMVIVSHANADGQLWVTPLTGDPGFASAMDPETVIVRPTNVHAARFLDDIHEGSFVGLLAIELATRRRIRVNGQIASAYANSFTIHVREAYGNCPKYIQARQLDPRSTDVASDHAVQMGEVLSAEQRLWIARSDTFFLGTSGPNGDADASHRGGAPGFVRVAADGRRLIFPDYAGNNMFNSLGNLASNPKAGLLFVDFDSGDVLQLTGTSVVDWDASRTSQFDGAHRVIDFEIAKIVETRSAIPLRWMFVAASPFNPTPS